MTTDADRGRWRALACLGWLVAASLALTSTGCQSPGSVTCRSGRVCPAGQHCAANQDICFIGTCGNAIVDPGEQCDDGNLMDKDGCSPTCTKESCGNHNMDPGVYPDAITRATAVPVAKAKSIVFDMSDNQPASFGATAGQGEWGLFQDFLKNPKNASGIAKKLESAAAKAYKKAK